MLAPCQKVNIIRPQDRVMINSAFLMMPNNPWQAGFEIERCFILAVLL
jgi:hypothetical protein